jgi:hypothetical protein
LTTATVLEFSLISPPSLVVVALFYHISYKNSGNSLKKHPVNFPNQLLFVISRFYMLALDKTQETPGDLIPIFGLHSERGYTTQHLIVTPWWDHLSSYQQPPNDRKENDRELPIDQGCV